MDQFVGRQAKLPNVTGWSANGSALPSIILHGGLEPVGKSVIRELVEKTSQVVPESDWQVYYAFFARAGFTEAALDEANRINTQFIDLALLDHALRNGG